jgi:hypothetical protein
LQKTPGIIFYGEIFGQVLDLKYGANTNQLFLRLFDAFDIIKCCYVGYDQLVQLADIVGLDLVPILYRGPWNLKLMSLSNGPTTIAGANHCREGFVVRPIVERLDNQVGRVVLKLVGEDYLLRK